MLEVRGGDTIAIATREAVADDDLHRLETEVLATFQPPASTKSRRRAPMRSGFISRPSARSYRFLRVRTAARRCRGGARRPLRRRSRAMTPAKPENPRATGRGGQDAAGAARALAARGRALARPEPGDDRRARLDHRAADADRHLRRPLARPALRHRDLLDTRAARRGPAVGCTLAWKRMHSGMTARSSSADLALRR